MQTRPTPLARLSAAAILGLGAALVYRLELRPRMRSWGATIVERTRTLPGDELVATVGVQITHAVTIAAPLEEVWPELAETVRQRSLDGDGVRVLEPGRALGLEGWGAFLLEPVGDGSTRLIARDRIPAGLASLTYATALEPLRFAQRRQLLLRIKARAEAP